MFSCISSNNSYRKVVVCHHLHRVFSAPGFFLKLQITEYSVTRGHGPILTIIADNILYYTQMSSAPNTLLLRTRLAKIGRLPAMRDAKTQMHLWRLALLHYQ